MKQSFFMDQNNKRRVHTTNLSIKVKLVKHFNQISLNNIPTILEEGHNNPSRPRFQPLDFSLIKWSLKPTRSLLVNLTPIKTLNKRVVNDLILTQLLVKVCDHNKSPHISLSNLPSLVSYSLIQLFLLLPLNTICKRPVMNPPP